MKIQKKLIRSYHCEICNTGYKTPELAMACERMPIENLVACIGDEVHVHERRSCTISGKTYIVEGVIAKITPPSPPDEEYEIKWLGGKRDRLEMHNRRYIVSYKCPHCKEKCELLVYAPEFTILKILKPKAKLPQNALV